jgi:D-alanyl-D-alanine carboxypeptidase (penicillin-binding protein 5/6)
MMRRQRTTLSLSFFTALLLSHALLAGPADAAVARRAARKPVESGKPTYAAAILMEPTTGRILFERESHKPWPPASLTKMMLMLVVMEKVKQKAISLNDRVIIPARVAKLGGAQLSLKQGEAFTLEELMQAVVIHSANDAAAAVAERIAGDAGAFVTLMNRRAQELGMKETKYHSVHGLPPETGRPADVTSAYDVAILARELVKYPEILKWASTVKQQFRGGKFVLENSNRLIGQFPGADGLKTGSYREAGFNLAATAERGGRRFIAVTLGSASDETRAREAAALLSTGFNEYMMLAAMKAGQALAQDIRVRGGRVDAIRAVAASAAQVLIKRSEAGSVRSSVQIHEPVWAPLKKGDKVGELTVMAGDKPLGKFPLVSDRDVEQADIARRLWDWILLPAERWLK